jgi:histidine ammonia-lyase
MTLSIDSKILLSDVHALARGSHLIELSAAARERITSCREFLDSYLDKNEKAVYGINTGFGALADTAIAKKDLAQLQLNLVRSHACGMGEEIAPELVRAMILLKIQGLSLGHSGVKLDTVQLLVDCFNKDILPIIYTKGSLGASGDLAPLAHLSMTLLGEGEVRYNGKVMSSAEALKAEGLKPVILSSKEGLALLNGTQFMSAHGSLLCQEAENLFRWADTIAAISLEAMDGHLAPFYKGIHEVRPHPGQQKVAAFVRKILKDSKGIGRKKEHVQDPYCLRCVPQVHGASWDTLEHVKKVMAIEISSVTDNPTIFPKEGLIISAGNFHGQPLAIALDTLAIAMAEIASISERRTYKMNCGVLGLPAFLIEAAGLNSGFMITQYTSASLVSENKQLCTPASVDTIDSSKGQEDHVSMGANAATKAMRVLENMRGVLAIELFNAAQAIELRGIGDTSSVLKEIILEFRKTVPFITEDVYMYPLMKASNAYLKSHEAPRI